MTPCDWTTTAIVAALFLAAGTPLAWRTVRRSPDECEHCGGTGMLNIVSTVTVEEIDAPWVTRWDDTPDVDDCHVCRASEDHR